LVEEGHRATAALAVADRHGLIRAEAYGAPVDGVFLLASITKPIVASGVMQLVEEGRLLLNDPVARHIPEFAANGKGAVTVRHLLTHTSGIDDSYEQAPPEPGQRRDALRAVCATGLRWEPGTRFAYSNPPFRVLGELLTRLGGLPYPAFLAERIFDPLGMTSTTFDPRPTMAARMVPVEKFTLPQGLGAFIDEAPPAGGLWSTLADLVAFGRAWLRPPPAGLPRLLGPAALEAMTRVQFAGTFDIGNGHPAEISRGLGWNVAGPHHELESPDAISHGGATGTRLLIDPRRGVVAVFLTNVWGDEQRDARLITNAVLADADVPAPS
jgi:CubicO group peptidase (beta-lactamase class C family)